MHRRHTSVHQAASAHGKEHPAGGTKFPLKHLKSDSSAAARMMLTTEREPTARSNATAVMNFSP